MSLEKLKQKSMIHFMVWETHVYPIVHHNRWYFVTWQQNILDIDVTENGTKICNEEWKTLFLKEATFFNASTLILWYQIGESSLCYWTWNLFFSSYLFMFHNKNIFMHFCNQFPHDGTTTLSLRLKLIFIIFVEWWYAMDQVQ